MSNPTQRKIVLITGVSSGFGEVTAKALAADGHCVYGTSRRPGEGPDGVRMLALDVTDDDQVRDAVAKVLEDEGRIDVLINNAGISVAGAIEDTSIEEVKLQIDTNFFGTVRMAKAVLAPMRAQKSGLIVNISSLGGIIGLPYQGVYSASKFAIEGFADALRIEMSPYGVRVVNVLPGDFRTSMPDKRIRAAASAGSVHEAQFLKTLAGYENDERTGSDPADLAKLIAGIVADPSPRGRYAAGNFGQRFAAGLRRVMPTGVFDAVMKKYCGIASA